MPKVYVECPAILDWLHFFSIFASCCMLGTYARIGIQILSNYTYSFITPGTAMWPNFTSSMIMGIAQILNEADVNWFVHYPYLFTGITNGFCGSFSSYSTMIIESFLFSSSLNVYNLRTGIILPNKAYGIFEFISVLFCHLFISMSSYLFGRQFAKDILVFYLGGANGDTHIDIDSTEFANNGTESFNFSHDTEQTIAIFDTEQIDSSKINHSTATKSTPFNAIINIILRYLDFVLTILAIPLIITIIVLSIYYDNYSRGSWTLSALFVLFGSFLRYYVSNIFNARIPSFPIGTFLVNQISVTIYCFLTIVERGKISNKLNIPIANSANKCRIVTALTTGFCGGLSTISTFVHEGYNLPFRNMLLYYLLTVVVSISFCIIIMGSYAWAVGFTLPMC